MMKRFILTALLACAIAAPAGAVITQRQNGTGDADWIGSRGPAGSCIGGITLQGNVSLTTPSTDYLVSPLTNAFVRDFYTVAQGTTTGGNSLIKVYTVGPNNGAVNSTIPVGFRGASGISHAVITIGGASAGLVKTISTLSQAGATEVISNTVFGKSAVVVGSTGGGTGTNISAKVLVDVCPR